MKNLTNSFAIATTGITLVLGLSNAPANAMSFNFTQSGWTGGGEVTGMFTGTDINGNGSISFSTNPALNEVTAYMMSFTGNLTIPTFTNNLVGLQSLTYILGSSSFTDVSSTNGTFGYDGTFGNIFPPTGSGVLPITTLAMTVVTPKPVPEATPLTALLILGISGCLHRQLVSSKKSKNNSLLG